MIAMKRLLGLKALCLATVVCSNSIASAQTLEEWNDVKVTSINRMPAHTLDIPMASVADAKGAYTPTNALEASPYFLSLNGTWKFQWVADPSKAQENAWVPAYCNQTGSNPW